MLWWRRCLVLVPVASFIVAALVFSSGNEQGGITAVAHAATSLSSVVICAGSPPVPTPTPMPTKMRTRTPTPTPTPACTPVNSASANVGGAIQLNCQGTFVGHNKHKAKFRDVTNSASTVWLDLPSSIVSYVGNGQYLGLAQGCTCVQTRVASGVLSQPVSIAIGSPSPACTPCPQ